MPDSRTITIDDPTKKASVVGIAALCVCVIGALLVVGRGGGGTSFAAAARAASTPGQPQGDGGAATDGATGQDGGGDGAAAPTASLERFRQCLQDQGVTLPDPSERRQGERPALTDTLRRAFEACRQYLPERPFGGRFRGDGPSLGSPPDGQGPGGNAPESPDGSTF
jgi:hypothetical protein